MHGALFIKDTILLSFQFQSANEVDQEGSYCPLNRLTMELHSHYVVVYRS